MSPSNYLAEPGQAQAMMDNPFRLPQENDTNLLQCRQQRLGSEKPVIGRSYKQLENKTTASNGSQNHNPPSPKLNPPIEAMYKENDILSRGNPDHRMSLKEFVSKKREMLMLNMQIDTQQENIEKLGQQLKDREDALKAKEESFAESIKKFDAFLKETDEKARNAQRLAEMETAKRVMKQQEVADIKDQLKAVEFLIAKHNDNLEEYSRSKQFLDSLTPPSWFHKCAAEKRKRQQQRRRDRIRARQEAYKKEQQTLSNQKTVPDKVKRPPTRTGKTAAKQVNQDIIAVPDFEDEPMTSSDEETPMYFQKPEDLSAKIEESLHLRNVSTETADESMQSACTSASGCDCCPEYAVLNVESIPSEKETIDSPE